MRNDLVEVVLIVDRSGSMANIAVEAEQGINQLITDQQNTPGYCNLTLVDFSSTVNVKYNGVDIRTTNPYKMTPEGMTKLNDAIGYTIDMVGARLAKTEEKDRPSLVLVNIMTDGEENSSREYKSQEIHDMIKHQEEKYNWKFNFMSAGLKAIEQSDGLNLGGLKSMAFDPNNVAVIYKMSSDKIKNARYAANSGQAHTVDMNYTKEDMQNDIR